MLKKICSYPSCNNLIDKNERYCKTHQIPKKTAPFQNAVRTNENLYSTAKWRRLKRQILKENPYCSRCGIGEKDSVLEVHHIIPPRGAEDLFFDENNLISICQQCHRIITAQEIKDRKKG